MTSNDGENLPALRRAHETVPPDAPEDLLGYYEAVIAESVALAETEQHRAWLALEQIYSLQLWRFSHQSFGAYVDERWDVARSTAYRQIAWARTVRELPGLGTGEVGEEGEGVPRRGTVPSQRQVQGAKRPPQGPDEAVDAKATPTKPSGPAKTTPASVVSKKRPPKPVQGSLFDHLGKVLAANRTDVLAAVPVDRRLEVADRFQSWADALRRAAGPQPRTVARPEFPGSNFKKGT